MGYGCNQDGLCSTSTLRLYKRIHTWCFQDWFYLLDSCWNIQPSSNHNPANTLRESHQITRTPYENPKFHRLWSWRDETLLSSHKGLWKLLHQVAAYLASPPKQKTSMIKEPSLLLGWMLGNLSGGGPLVKNKLQDTKPVLCDDPPNWDESPFLTWHCRFRCRSLTLTNSKEWVAD